MRKFLLYLFLILIAVSMLIPFFAMVYLSFVPENQIFLISNPDFRPEFTLDNYKNVFQNLPILKYFLNSLFVAVITTIGQVIIALFAGYAFARMKFRGSNALFFIILITMMIPPQVNIIPLFWLMSKLHLINTYHALILPGLFGGFGIFLMRQHFLIMSKELEDAAKIDGCNIFQTVVKISMPLAMPAIATLGIFTFVSSWNSFMWPLIATTTESMRTLPLGLAEFRGSFREIILWGQLLACSVICAVPAILVFLIGKKYIISDILKGGVKE